MTDFQNAFTGRLSRVATRDCEIVVFKNRNDLQLCKEHCHSKHTLEVFAQ